jgi:hypothetical protein
MIWQKLPSSSLHSPPFCVPEEVAVFHGGVLLKLLTTMMMDYAHLSKTSC